MDTLPGPQPFRAGLFSIGLEAYWSQFAGLKEKLTGYNQIRSRLRSNQFFFRAIERLAE